MVAILKSAAIGALRAKANARIRRPGGPLEPRLSDSCGLEITAKPATASRRTNVTTTWVVCSGSARAGALTRRPVTFASACAGRSIPLTPRPVWGCRETASRSGSYQARTAAATPYGRSGPPRHCIRSSPRQDRHRIASSISCTPP
jgi:hypothetical protein